MSLVTRCPKCQSDFVVSLEQLRAHEGLVRCGQCKHIFDGETALLSNLPTLTSLVSTPSAVAQRTTQPAVLRHRERQASDTVLFKARHDYAGMLVRQDGRSQSFSLIMKIPADLKL